MGRPAVVVADIDLTAGWETHLVTPALQQLFVGRYLDLEGVECSVHYSQPVPARDIVDIWQPGQAEYDQFEDLCAD